MTEYHYQICGVHLHLLCEHSLVTDADTKKFICASDVSPQLEIQIQTAQQLVCPENARSLSANHVFWQQGETVVRGSRTHETGALFFSTAYRPGEKVCAQVCAKEQEWAMREEHLWPGLALPSLLLPFRALVFHASYILWNGRAILFTAPSGTGKSTQAALWKAHRGACIVNGDKAGVTLRGMPCAHGVPFAGTSGICHNKTAPLAAVVVLSQAKENHICRLSPVQAVTSLCKNLFVNTEIVSEGQMSVQLLLDLVEQVPVYALACTPDEGAVRTLESVLIS